ncbi:MAG: sugar transferase [Flavobacteriaceae bacterium]
MLVYILILIRYRVNPIFCQERVGYKGELFELWKFRTLISTDEIQSFPPRSNAKFLAFLRFTKLDELPQIIQVISGDMSLVGPRPDLPGYADLLQGYDRNILSLRPGLTGLATLKFRNEDALLAKQDNPKTYNDQVIWPEKVRLNLYYLEHYSLGMDLDILMKSVTK